MFMVHENTAKEIFRAGPKAPGKAAARYPVWIRASRPRQADEHSARLRRDRRALRTYGRRLRRGSGGIGPDGLRSRQGFLPDAVPPPPDAVNQLLLMPDADSFERFVVLRINRVFGLGVKNRHYDSALRELAHDFNDWCRTDDAKDDFVVEKHYGKVFFKCKTVQPNLPALEPADKVRRLSFER